MQLESVWHPWHYLQLQLLQSIFLLLLFVLPQQRDAHQTQQDQIVPVLGLYELVLPQKESRLQLQESRLQESRLQEHV